MHSNIGMPYGASSQREASWAGACFKGCRESVPRPPHRRNARPGRNRPLRHRTSRRACDIGNFDHSIRLPSTQRETRACTSTYQQVLCPQAKGMPTSCARGKGEREEVWKSRCACIRACNKKRCHRTLHHPQPRRYRSYRLPIA